LHKLKNKEIIKELVFKMIKIYHLFEAALTNEGKLMNLDAIIKSSIFKFKCNKN
jgi:hypothetical protein